MITIGSEAHFVIVKIEHGLPAGPDDTVAVKFSFPMNDRISARALSEVLRRHFVQTVEDVRRSEYERGFHDGRGHRGRRRHFFGSLVPWARSK